MGQKLELTWIGKGDEYKLENRIIIEKKDFSYGDPNTENMLINGDNLLALKALEQKFTGKIKCIYIDPPYNTGSAFQHYDDGVEHSKWLELMSARLILLKKLLTKDGFLFVSISDDEGHYLKVLMDEVFGRNNYIGSFIWEKKKKPAFLSHIGVVTEYIFIYTKEKKSSQPLYYGTTKRGKKYPINNAGNGVKVITFPANSVVFNMKDQRVKAQNMSRGNIITELLDEVQIVNGRNIESFRLKGEWRYSQSKIDQILKNNEEIRIAQIPFRPNHVKNEVSKKKIMNLLSRSHFNISTYEDATDEIIKLFGSKVFDYPKPEHLVQIILETVTTPNDFVLDSFLGSATTAAVAHKLGRRWIGIELGDHAKSLCVHRLKSVIDGEQGGISTKVGWQGGGGYRYYELAPSLLEKDQYGMWVISKEYDPTMLAEAVATQEGFTFQPHESVYWKHGYSSEKDYIFTTAKYITVEMLIKIHDEMQEDESLLIACKKFQSECLDKFSNITIQKISGALLRKCEFGRDDSSFNIFNAMEEVEKEIDHEEISSESEESSSETESKSDNPQCRLF